MTDPRLRLHLLYAMRSQIDAMILVDEAESGQEPDVSTECPHPEEMRQDLRTLGNMTPQFKCGRCGAVVEGLP